MTLRLCYSLAVEYVTIQNGQKLSTILPPSISGRLEYTAIARYAYE